MQGRFSKNAPELLKTHPLGPFPFPYSLSVFSLQEGVPLTEGLEAGLLLSRLDHKPAAQSTCAKRGLWVLPDVS